MSKPIENHGAHAVGRLLAQFRGRPRLEGVARALGTVVQGLEDVSWQVRAGRAVDTAEGAQLDVLGRVVGRERGALSDEEYRVRIKTQIALNLSSGTPGEIVGLFRLLMPNGIQLLEQAPAAFVLRILGVLPIPATEALELLREAKPGGVRALLEWSDVPEDQLLKLDETPGLGDSDDPSVGGKLSSAVVATEG